MSDDGRLLALMALLGLAGTAAARGSRGVARPGRGPWVPKVGDRVVVGSIPGRDQPKRGVVVAVEEDVGEDRYWLPYAPGGRRNSRTGEIVISVRIDETLKDTGSPWHTLEEDITPEGGSRGIARASRGPVNLSPTEGTFRPHRFEPSTIIVGPSRWDPATTAPRRMVRLTDGDINMAAGQAMTQLNEGYMRDPGTAMVVARSNPRSKAPRETAFAAALWNAKRDGYRVVVFRGTTFSIARLDPAHDRFFPYSDSALNDTTGTQEAARRWLIEQFEEAWTKREAVPGKGSAGIARTGRPPAQFTRWADSDGSQSDLFGITLEGRASEADARRAEEEIERVVRAWASAWNGEVAKQGLRNDLYAVQSIDVDDRKDTSPRQIVGRIWYAGEWSHDDPRVNAVIHAADDAIRAVGWKAD